MKQAPNILPVAQRPGREADHLPPSTELVKNEWSYTATPYTCLLLKEGYFQENENLLDGKPTENTNRALGPHWIFFPAVTTIPAAVTAVTAVSVKTATPFSKGI